MQTRSYGLQRREIELIKDKTEVLPSLLGNGPLQNQFARAALQLQPADRNTARISSVFNRSQQMPATSREGESHLRKLSSYRGWPVAETGRDEVFSARVIRSVEPQRYRMRHPR